MRTLFPTMKLVRASIESHTLLTLAVFLYDVVSFDTMTQLPVSPSSQGLGDRLLTEDSRQCLSR